VALFVLTLSSHFLLVGASCHVLHCTVRYKVVKIKKIVYHEKIKAAYEANERSAFTLLVHKNPNPAITFQLFDHAIDQ
jgi:hypothetical protein